MTKEHTPVVSLVIQHEDMVLLGIRAATITSGRHPNVLSSPTMRIPRSLMHAALEEIGVDIPALGEIRLLHGPRQVRFGCRDSMKDQIAYLAECLLARKLGVSDALVTGRLNGRAVPRAIALDVVADEGTITLDEELTLMLSIQLYIESGLTQFPASTPSYSHLGWFAADRVQEAVALNDALILLPNSRPWEVCLHGLCVRSAAEIL
jgi:transcriptional regulator with XRE-family HTH domain